MKSYEKCKKYTLIQCYISKHLKISIYVSNIAFIKSTYLCSLETINIENNLKSFLTQNNL